MSDRLLSQIEIARRFGKSDEWWRRRRQAGTAPQPITLDGRPLWREQDIDAFAARIAAPCQSPRRRFFAKSQRHAHTMRPVGAER